MEFYGAGEGLEEAISAGEKPARVRIEIDLGGRRESVFERDVVEAAFYGIKEAAGGASARGALLLDNPGGIYSYRDAGPGTKVAVYFTVGEGLPWLKRFAFRIDERGIQDLRGPGRERRARIGLVDESWRLRRVDEANDWTAPAAFAYSVACDKARPEKSLAHLIAARAGIGPDATDCATVPIALPFVRLRRNVWAELSALAKACRCHLECAPDGSLIFRNSPYQEEPASGKAARAIGGGDIFHLRASDRADLYRNTVRLKLHMPVALPRQEIWRYDEPPVIYGERGGRKFPFFAPHVREIEAGRHEAKYRVAREGGGWREVVFADEVDSREEAESRLESEGANFRYSAYDADSSIDKAWLTLARDGDGYLLNASIHGRPIALDLNRSSFVRDAESVARNGAIPLNVTGRYFSEHDVGGVPHYQDWAARELAARTRRRREFSIGTHRALFGARAGAKMKIKLRDGEAEGEVTAFRFRHRRGHAFETALRVLET